MRLIHTNDQLYSLLPNIMTVVKGERPVIDKIVPFIDASEKCWSSESRTSNSFWVLCRVVTALRYTKWLIDNFWPKEIFDEIADRPDPSSAKVTMARIVAFDAFRSAIPQPWHHPHTKRVRNRQQFQHRTGKQGKGRTSDKQSARQSRQRNRVTEHTCSTNL